MASRGNSRPVETATKSKSRKPENEKSVEERYTKMTPLEHILRRPDTYVGSLEKQTQSMCVLDLESKMIVFRQVTFVPGLFKIFDEIVVNASDNKQRDPSMNRIEVTIDPQENYIRVWNNGKGIDIAVHQEHGIYVPELIFGNLLTGSNFDDDEAKTTGGRNGYGAKLANIFSTKFTVETSDKFRGLKFKQVFSKNMTERREPVVKESTGSDFTCVTFFPDLRRFNMDCLDEDIVSLFSKRVYDIAGTNTASGKLSVYLNGQRVEARTFEQYMGLYQGIEAPVAVLRVNERWEIGVGVSDGSFRQVSFVNSICTSNGGCHVTHIAEQIISQLAGVVKRKNKGQEVKPNQIKNHLRIFVNALIDNPAFDSQTKETLTTKLAKFGSSCEVPSSVMKALEKSPLVERVLSYATFLQTNQLKKLGGTKRSKLLGLTKLDDANMAGTARSAKCTLILTEGDSAKALAVSGLGVVGRDYYGVFPLKGKLLNVREASHKQIVNNDEIQNVAKIMGLVFGKVYSGVDVSSLRYGHLMIMTDQDHDGSHIKGLLINFLHHFWPSLLQIDGFLQQFITPIVKCTKGKKERTFFTIPEYKSWYDQTEGKGWKIKYYKGLGTSTAAEAKEYFRNLQRHQIDFQWDPHASDAIDMAFSKKRVEDRKVWLLSKEPDVCIDYNGPSTYDDFVNKELILFSAADNDRSICHMMDGLKPSQRKVLFACFKRNLKQEIKVAQLAGYVSEHSAYHHGETSLCDTIIGLAQDYVGSNNINLLSPCGQFGTRLMGGKDAASPRYLFTKLETIARIIFHPADDPVLEFQEEEGQRIEPLYYIPIIPMALVNGSEGIGTGWSSKVLQYNPRDIVAALRLMIAQQQPRTMYPWYRGFTGSILPKGDKNSHAMEGMAKQSGKNTVTITELPIGKWTTSYKQVLESMAGAGTAPSKDPFVDDFKECHTDTTVHFTVVCKPGTDLTDTELAKKFKLDGSLSGENMNMFDVDSRIKKYDRPESVLQEFFHVRLECYDRRKAHHEAKLQDEWEKLDNKARFITALINEDLVVSNRTRQVMLQTLSDEGYKPFEDKGEKDDKGEGEGEDEDEEGPKVSKGFDYLLNMKIWALTREKAVELYKLRDAKREELDILQAKTAEELWGEDLDALEVALDDLNIAASEQSGKSAVRGGKGTPERGTTRRVVVDDDSNDSTYEQITHANGSPKEHSSRPKRTAHAVTASHNRVRKLGRGVITPVTMETMEGANDSDGNFGIHLFGPSAPHTVSRPPSGRLVQPHQRKPDSEEELEDSDARPSANRANSSKPAKGRKWSARSAAAEASDDDVVLSDASSPAAKKVRLPTASSRRPPKKEKSAPARPCASRSSVTGLAPVRSRHAHTSDDEIDGNDENGESENEENGSGDENDASGEGGEDGEETDSGSGSGDGSDEDYSGSH
ncbi:DNA topoisomerase [Ochromonadaceae sp. CCMP2298]|nr:DNA topoisomerase [Ochromonadaceae sp. CCMP2298]